MKLLRLVLKHLPILLIDLKIKVRVVEVCDVLVLYI